MPASCSDTAAKSDQEQIGPEPAGSSDHDHARAKLANTAPGISDRTVRTRAIRVKNNSLIFQSNFELSS